jgi:hypothetical protein
METITTSYLTHDNGARPFKVIINGDHHQTVQVWKQSIEIRLSEACDQYDVPVIPVTQCDEIWIGQDKYAEWTKGSCILLRPSKLTLEYILIGVRVVRFQAHSEIISFQTPMGNSDVVYPWAIDSTQHVYLLTQDKHSSMKSFTTSAYLLDNFTPDALSNCLVNNIHVNTLEKREAMIDYQKELVKQDRCPYQLFWRKKHLLTNLKDIQVVESLVIALDDQ